MENLTVKVFGSGCKNCQILHKNVIDSLSELGISADVEYITNLQKIMEEGIMSMPALMVNGEIVSSGKVLSVNEVKRIISKI